jgi:hypothetical protein
MDEAIDGGERHSLIREDAIPFCKGLIGWPVPGKRGDRTRIVMSASNSMLMSL